MANTFTYQSQSIAIGDTVIVQQKIKEGGKFRNQPFEGIVISIKNRAENKTFTVRKIASASIGVERIWSINSPWISAITIKKRGSVRRAKLYYLRQRIGKRATLVKTAS